MKLVVVGGVAAGMSAAARARRLDESAEIVVFEKGPFVSFANCGLPYHISGTIKERDALLLQTPKSLAESLNLDVRCGVEVLSVDRAAKTVQVRDASGKTETVTYDKLVLAPGAVPLRPPLPGLDHPRIFTLRNIEDMDRIKAQVDSGAKSAAIIGGGYIGVEMAENLKERGLDVTLVEMAPQLMPPLDREMAHDLEIHMKWHGVQLHLGVAAAAFTDAHGQVRVELVNGVQFVTDLVVFSAGVKPDVGLARAAGLTIGDRGGIRVNDRMQTSDPDIYAAGDAIEVEDFILKKAALLPLAGPANRQGRIAAENVCGRDSRYRGSQGTAIVKIFDMTGGGTGANERALLRDKIPYRKVYLHPSGHAGYYPGSAPMHMKVLFTPDDGRILGAQVVGFDGVDKRIDVLATAIRAGLGVKDLESLELAYAPPFGSAKDPVNMAGFVASNLLAGDLDLWYAEDYPEGTKDAVIVDVRSKPEYETWHIPGAILIPLGSLRARMGELPKEKKILVYCRVGFRSYLAFRILKQSGFPVATLAGGTLTFCSYHGTGLCEGKPEPALLSYAEEPMQPPAPLAAEAGQTLNLDCRGLQCPGPIRRLSEAVQKLQAGDEVTVQ
ncbi:MAG: FAD-dependent oxidoreductase, partial [Kiritimatiellia bacterium]|nr:FAD-dependent oxidoreductase [Kiritimatiellia bacterium]